MVPNQHLDWCGAAHQSTMDTVWYDGVGADIPATWEVARRIEASLSYDPGAPDSAT